MVNESARLLFTLFASCRVAASALHSSLKKLELQEIITEEGMYDKAAKRQRLVIIMGRTALALKVYKIEHGKYPGKLSVLVPNYLSEEYVSPSTGKKLDYSVKGTNFTLSVDGSSITSER